MDESTVPDLAKSDANWAANLDSASMLGGLRMFIGSVLDGLEERIESRAG